jgi:hypothetical protein
MTPETRCPWCDGSDLRPQARDGLAWMLCLDCGATGPNAPLPAREVTPTEERRLAVAAWDRHAATPGPDAERAAEEAVRAAFGAIGRPYHPQFDRAAVDAVIPIVEVACLNAAATPGTGAIERAAARILYLYRAGTANIESATLEGIIAAILAAELGAGGAQEEADHA